MSNIRRSQQEKAEISFPVIEMFISEKDNRTIVIAQKLGLPITVTSEIISDYLKNDKCIIVGSKMNRNYTKTSNILKHKQNGKNRP